MGFFVLSNVFNSWFWTGDHNPLFHRITPVILVGESQLHPGADLEKNLSGGERDRMISENPENGA